MANFFVRSFSDMEQGMTSVERVLYFTDNIAQVSAAAGLRV